MIRKILGPLVKGGKGGFVRKYSHHRKQKMIFQWTNLPQMRSRPSMQKMLRQHQLSQDRQRRNDRTLSHLQKPIQPTNCLPRMPLTRHQRIWNLNPESRRIYPERIRSRFDNHRIRDCQFRQKNTKNI